MCTKCIIPGNLELPTIHLLGNTLDRDKVKLTHKMTGCVTSVRVLGLHEIEIEKPQKNLQTNFIRLMIEHKGGSTEERKVLQTDWELLCLAAFINRTKLTCAEWWAFGKKWTSFNGYGAWELRSSLRLGARWRTAHYLHPRKVIQRSNLDQLCLRNRVSTSVRE